MGLNLFTRQEYKSYMGINSANSDGEIDSLIPKVSQFAKTYCKRTFIDYYNDPLIEYYEGGYDRILLKETPAANVVSVQKSINYGQSYTALVKFTDWVQDGDDVVCLHSSGIFEKLIRGYKITYFGGYEFVPEDLKAACMDLLTYYKDNDSAVKSTKSAGTNTTQIEYVITSSLPAHIRRVFDLYMADYA